MSILIKSGKVIDPANNLEETRDILIEAGKISEVAKNIKTRTDQTIDAQGKLVIPGLVDMHVHLREPGREDKETVLSGTKAALKGGITSLLAMPNTEPAIDSPEAVKLLKGIIKKDSRTNVFIAAAITKGRKGVELAGISTLSKEGAIAITDDGSSVDSDSLMTQALEIAKSAGILVICHSEDKSLSNHGVVNAGFTATRLGLRGICRESEYKRIDRDLRLAQKTGASIHIAHLSCKESVSLIAQAKKSGIKVTCETAPHYFSLSDDAVLSYDTNMKMNPPLRGSEDVEAIKQGLKSGIIDAIASDHAPHTENEKEIEFDRAEFGVIGLETELPVSITELLQNKILSWSGLIQKLAVNPARILKINKGSLGVGSDADIAIIDPQADWTVTKSSLISKSKNSPFLSKKLKGMVKYTILAGNIVYQAE